MYMLHISNSALSKYNKKTAPSEERFLNKLNFQILIIG